MNIKEFKNEYKLTFCGDHWGSAMGAWFECAGHLHKRGEDIPSEWEYSPGIGCDGTDEDSYWFSLFSESSSEQLTNIGNLLFRYCEFLKFKGVDY